MFLFTDNTQAVIHTDAALTSPENAFLHGTVIWYVDYNVFING